MLQEKIENALNEARILALVAEVVLGFEYQAVFQPGFQRLTHTTQNLRLVGLGGTLLAIALLLAPAAYHQVVEAGHLSEKLNRFVSKMVTVALVPFAVAMGIDFHTVGLRVLSPTLATGLGVSLVLTALFWWYGVEGFVVYRERGTRKEPPAVESELIDLKERIKFVLMEARVVLPGVQALLGFQFAAVLTDSFEKLPTWLQWAHLLSLVCGAFCTVLLMTPAAFHRIVERGQATDRMEAFSRRMVLAAMAFLAPGIAGDVLVVTAKVTRSTPGACTAGALVLLVFYSFWFGYTFYLKSRQPEKTGAFASSSLPGP